MENQIRLSRSILWLGVLASIYLSYITLTHEEYLIFKLIGIGSLVVFFLIYQYDAIIISEEELTTELNSSKTQKLLIFLNYKIHAIFGDIQKKTLQEVVLTEDTATKEKDLADLKTLFNFSTIVQFKRFVNFLFHYNILMLNVTQNINKNKGDIYSYFIDNYKTTKESRLTSLNAKANKPEYNYTQFENTWETISPEHVVVQRTSEFIAKLKESEAVKSYYNTELDEDLTIKRIQAYLYYFEIKDKKRVK